MKCGAMLLVMLTAIVMIGAAAPAFRKPAAKDRDATAEEWRWRHGQPTHWRACLLQR